MKVTAEKNKQIATMTFASVYPHYVTKVEKKGRTKQAKLHPNAHLIKGVICGYRIEDIDDEFEIYRQVRYLDKLVDELAKGRKMEKILRTV